MLYDSVPPCHHHHCHLCHLCYLQLVVSLQPLPLCIATTMLHGSVTAMPWLLLPPLSSLTPAVDFSFCSHFYSTTCCMSVTSFATTANSSWFFAATSTLHCHDNFTWQCCCHVTATTTTFVITATCSWLFSLQPLLRNVLLNLLIYQFCDLSDLHALNLQVGLGLNNMALWGTLCPQSFSVDQAINKLIFCIKTAVWFTGHVFCMLLCRCCLSDKCAWIFVGQGCSWRLWLCNSLWHIHLITICITKSKFEPWWLEVWCIWV